LAGNSVLLADGTDSYSFDDSIGKYLIADNIHSGADTCIFGWGWGRYSYEFKVYIYDLSAAAYNITEATSADIRDEHTYGSEYDDMVCFSSGTTDFRALDTIVVYRR
jgi:hypothetical protein